MIERLSAFRRALKAYNNSPLFGGEGPLGLEVAPALTIKGAADALDVTRHLADAARSLAKAAASQFDVRVLTKLANDLVQAAAQIDVDATCHVGQFDTRQEHYADMRDSEALVEAIEARVATPRDKLANAFGMLAADPQLALLTDGELAKRFGVSRTTLFNDPWKKLRAAIDAVRQREAPSPSNRDEDA